MTDRSGFLLSLTENLQVLPEQAFIDRIQLTVGDWGLFGTTDNVCETFTELRLQEVVTAEGVCIPLFSGDPIFSLQQHLNIRFSSPNNDDENTGVAPLVSGAIWYADRYRRPEALRHATSRVHFQTSLNLTRFVQAQKFKLRTPLNRRPRLFFSSLAMAIEPDEAWYKEERPLVPATNVIIGPWTKYAYAMSKSLEQHFLEYLELLDELLSQSLTNSTPENVEVPLREEHYSLQEIEFYWEFDCDNPITTVIEFLPRLRSVGSTFFEGLKEIDPPTDISGGADRQSPSIKAKIAEGTWLKVYAKTTRRIRFEIELEAGIIGKKACGQTADSKASLSAKIGPLKQYATDKLNAIIPVLLAPPLPQSNLPALRLIHEIVRACGDPHLAETIIGSLVAFDRVTNYRNPPLKDAIQRLSSREVLKTVVPGSRNYVVQSEYEQALKALKRLTSGASSI
jgi:hypothetical protein